MDQNNEPSEILRTSYDSLWTLVSLWDEMGIDDHQRENRLRRAQEMVNNLVQDLIAEEMETKRMVMERIQELKKRIEDLTNELGLPSSGNQLDESSSMVKKEKFLHSRVTQLRTMRQVRFSRYESLRLEDSSLSERLGKSALVIASEKRLPSENEIDILAERVKSLKEEINTRMTEVHRLRDELIVVLKDLDIDEPEGINLWSDLVDKCRSGGKFPLTDQSIFQLKSCLDHYRERRDTAETKCQSLIATIEGLWNRLETSENEREIFLAQLPISKPASLRLLEEEAQRLEELKRANMERFFEQCKVELRQWWERCHICEDDRLSWERRDPEEDLSDLVSRLESEIAHLKRYYEENKPAFEKVIEWNLAFEKLKITEQRMKDPSILSNRGGVLLKYEKTKRATLRQMKNLETALTGYIAARVEGQPVLVYIEQRRRAYEEEKENEKRERQEKHSHLLHKEMRFGSKPVVTPTNKRRILSTTQRVHNTTHATGIDSSIHPKVRKVDTAAEQFRKKLTSTPNTRTKELRTPQHSMSRSVFRTPITTPRSTTGSSRVSLAKRRQSRTGAAGGPSMARPVMDLKCLIRTPRRGDVANTTCTTTYSEFANDLESNPHSRSSASQSIQSHRTHQTPKY